MQSLLCLHKRKRKSKPYICGNIKSLPRDYSFPDGILCCHESTQMMLSPICTPHCQEILIFFPAENKSFSHQQAWLFCMLYYSITIKGINRMVPATLLATYLHYFEWPANFSLCSVCLPPPTTYLTLPRTQTHALCRAGGGNSQPQQVGPQQKHQQCQQENPPQHSRTVGFCMSLEAETSPAVTAHLRPP